MDIYAAGKTLLLALIVACAPLCAHGAWSGAWPASNPPTQFGGTPTGATVVTTLIKVAPYLESSGNTISTTMYKPTGETNLWAAITIASDLALKVGRSKIPTNIFTYTLYSNKCYSSEIWTTFVGNAGTITTNTETRYTTNVIYCSSTIATNYAYSNSPANHDFVVVPYFCVVSPTITNYCITTNDTWYINYPPSSTVTNPVTNSVANRLLCDLVVCLTNPVGVPSARCAAWATVTNGSFNFMNDTNYFQWMQTDYYGPTNWVRTNMSMRVEQAQIYDDAVAQGERQLVAWLIPPTQEISANAQYRLALINAKASALAMTGFAIKEFANGSGTFDGWTQIPDTNWVRAVNKGGWLFDKSTTWTEDKTSFWYKATSYLPPPQWSDVDGNMDTMNGWHQVGGIFYKNSSRLWEKGMKFGLEYFTLTNLSLPYGIINVVLTNKGMRQNGGDGGDKYALTNSLDLPNNILTHQVVYGSYFQFTPEKNTLLSNGLHHINSVSFNFTNITMLWASPNFYVNGTPYSPDTPYIVTNLNQLVTKSLVIPGNTSLDFSTKYWDTSNYWTHAESYRSSAGYEMKPLTLETHTTITTQNIQDLVIGQNCTSNPTAIFNDVYYTNVFFDPILITTNNLTNVEVTCFFTNVATYSLTVWRTDRSGVTDAPPWCSTCLPPGLSNVTTTTLLPTTTYNNFTNGVIVASTFTNWDIAQGYSESDYGYDGVRKIDSSKTWQSATVNWYNGKGINLISHGMTNNTTDIAGADADKLGSRSMCIITTSVAAAESALTNFGGSYSGAPFATRFVTLPDGTTTPCGNPYYKDRYNFSVNGYSALVGPSNVFVFTSVIIYTNYFPFDCTGGDTETRTCVSVYPGSGVMVEVESCADIASAVATATALSANNPSYCSNVCPSDGGSNNVTHIPVSDLVQGVDFIKISENYDFWSDSQPCVTNVVSSNDGTNILCVSGGWSLVGAVTNSVNSAYICVESDAPSFTNAIRQQLEATRESALGAINSISPRFECARDLYISGTVDLPSSRAIDTWYNTKYLKQGLSASGTLSVQLSTNEQTIYFPQLPDGATSIYGNNFLASFQHNVTTYPTYSVTELWCYGSNITMVVTNAQWTQYADLDTSETPTGFGTKAIDPDLGTPRYCEVGAVNGWTNLWNYNTFIKNTVTLPGDAAFDHLKGFGVVGGVLILKWDKTANGFSRP